MNLNFIKWLLSNKSHRGMEREQKGARKIGMRIKLNGISS